MATTALDTQAAVTQLARTRDVDGLRRFAEGLGPDQTYERARALSLALAVEGQLDSALAELGLGSAAALNGAARHTVDIAHVHLFDAESGRRLE